HAIALGYSPGVTVAMIHGPLVLDLERRDLGRGLSLLCLGGGMGLATLGQLVRITGGLNKQSVSRRPPAGSRTTAVTQSSPSTTPRAAPTP
ncbi:hypothetical protein D8M34_18435, partial [Microbacterium sp. HSID17254]